MHPDPDSSPLQPPTEGQDTAQEVLGGFPRHLTQQLIDDERRATARRLTLAPWLVGAGLAALALANPQEVLVGGGPQLLDAWSAGAPAGEAFSAGWLLRGVSSLFGLSLEPAAFLLSALFYGACAPLLAGLGRRVGLSASSALTVTLIVLLSPVAWLAGTTPGPEAAGLWVVTWLFSLVWGGHHEPAPARRGFAVLLVLALGAGLTGSLAWLLPAVAFALAGGTSPGQAGRRFRAIKWALIGSLVISVSYLLLGGKPEGTGLGVSPAALGTPGVLPGTEDPGLLGAVWRTLTLLPALGVCLLGLAALCFERRNESEEPPPRWLLGWALLPLAAFAVTGEARELPHLHLLPLAALGGFDFLGRREDELDARLVLSTVVLAAGLLLGSLHLLHSSDPLASWRAHAQESLEPTDLVVSSDVEHLYLLRVRWGVEALGLGEAKAHPEVLDRARGAGRRLVTDAPTEALPPSLASGTPLADLSPRPR